MADPITVSTAISSLAALSVATERLVELVKNTLPFLNQTNSDPTKECWRNTAVRLLSVAMGILIVYLSQEQLSNLAKTLWGGKSNPGSVVVLGLLASGGSGFWNAVLKYVGALKDVKKSEAAEKKAEAGG